MDLPDVIEGENMDAAIKKRLPGLFLLSFSTYIVCVPAAFTQIISFDLMLDLNSFPGNGYAWTFPAFVAGECASMGLCASTLDRYGRKIPYLIGSLMFIASSAACALSTEMMPFILFRGVEGFGAGIIIVTCIAQIFFDVEDPKLRYMANGIMSLGFGGGMLTGIFAGRAVMGVIDWPVAFWIFAILQALVMYPSLEILSNGRKSTLKVNPLAAIIITVWAGLFVFFLQKMYLDWNIDDPMAQMCLGLLVMLFLAFLLIEVRDPESMFHRKVKNAKLTAASLIFIVLLGVIDMGAVGFMVKIAFFTYQMSVMEAAPFFIILVCGAAVTAICISKMIDRTGHLIWLLLSAVLSPIALLSMVFVTEDDPSFLYALHLFVLGLAIGCLVSMLNATIQNRTNEDNNGAMMSFAIMVRTLSLWLGYNFYQLMADLYMKERIGATVDHWNSIMPVQLPSDSSIANLLVTPLNDFIRAIPGLTDEIATFFAEGVGVGFTYGAIAFVVVAVPVALLLVRGEKEI